MTHTRYSQGLEAQALDKYPGALDLVALVDDPMVPQELIILLSDFLQAAIDSRAHNPNVCVCPMLSVTHRSDCPAVLRESIEKWAHGLYPLKDPRSM